MSKKYKMPHLIDISILNYGWEFDHGWEFKANGYDYDSFVAGMNWITDWLLEKAPVVEREDVWKPQWISTKKQLPKAGQDALLWYSNHHCIAGYYDAEGNWWRYGDDEWMKYREDAPKYWMGLPEMPVPQED
jgi:hypothetical protein